MNNSNSQSAMGLFCMSPRSVLRWLMPIVALCISAISWADANRDPAAYTAASAHSAKPQQLYSVANQPNKLAAATAAQRACIAAQNSLPSPQRPTTGHCELVSVGGKAITSTASILATLPQTPHPLYLWRFQTAQSTVYLAGSVHILKPGLYPLASQYQAAFDASDKLVLEVNLGAFTPQQLQFKSMQYAMLNDAQTLSTVLPAQTYQRLAATTAEYGLPLAQMERFKPGFITQQLAVLALMSAGYDPTQGVEQFFTNQAAEKEIMQLETLDFQLNLLMNQPLPTQLALVEDTLAQMPQFEAYTADLIGAWLAGDDDRFEAAFTAQSGTSDAAQKFMTMLMDERNIGMADKIVHYLNTPGRYFVLIGTAHYVGDNSIIALLAQRGIKGQRIYSNQTISP